MKSLLKLTLLLAGVIGGLFTLAACDLDLSLGSNDPEVSAVNVDSSSIQNAYVIDEFNLSTIQLEVEMEEEDLKTVSLSETYLTSDSKETLESEGTHTLEGTYEGEPFDFDVTLVADNRTLLLHTIHTLGVMDASLEEDYETWIETIHGVSVSDAYFNEQDELVFSLSDESTLNVGKIHVSALDLSDALIEFAHIENESELIITYTDGTTDTLHLNNTLHTVQFKDFEGRVFDVQTLKNGASITYPSAPEVEGYVFDGYSVNPETATENQVIEAQYIKEDITLTFDTLTGNTFTITKPYGSSIDFPDPSNPDYDFMGWYQDEFFNVAFASSTMPSEDQTLYAKWVDVSTGETVNENYSAISMVESINRAIVGVNNFSSVEGEDGTGSGIVYKANADGSFNMITNHHVIENYESLQIVYEYFNNYYIVEDSDVSVLGTYAETDIAVIQFTPAQPVDTIEIADSYDVVTGERVYALGSPQGQNYVGSVTEGIVASPMRYMDDNGTRAIFIQHDAAISPGNSGGALVNAQGELIGMNTLKLIGENVEGMGFAITSNTLKRMIEDIEDDGTVSRALLGVSMSDPSQCTSEYGACIASVSPGSTADALGLQESDSITGYKTEFMDDFRVIYNGNYLYESVLNTLIGTEITIQYERAGNVITSDPIILD